MSREARTLRVVTLRGGTGLASVLRGLRDWDGQARAATDLTAIVTVTDDGGSSGRLRRALGVAPPGDVRNCLVALSPEEGLLAKLFQYRFPAGHGLCGHSLGNLLLSALTQTTGSFAEAVEIAGRILNVRGRVFPSTLEDVTLRARLADGSVVEGETAIGRAPAPIRGVELVLGHSNGRPRRLRALPEAGAALEEADLIVVGPGSLFTSLIPNLLVPGIRRALLRSRARKVYVMNLMTQPRETLELSALDHLSILSSYLKGRAPASKRSPSSPFDFVVVNRRSLSPPLLRRYAREGASPVVSDRNALEQLGVQVIEEDLLAPGLVARHDPQRLATLLCRLVARPALRPNR